MLTTEILELLLLLGLLTASAFFSATEIAPLFDLTIQPRRDLLDITLKAAQLSMPKCPKAAA